MRAPPNNGSSIELQERDVDLMRGLFESRAMTPAHATALYFGGRREAAKKRLWRLKAAGMIAERRHSASAPSLLSLSIKGLSVLRGRGILAEYPPLGPRVADRLRASDLTIRHELAVMDVKAAVHEAVARVPGLSLAEFCTWPRLHQFRAASGGSRRGEWVRPDGFVRVREPGGAESVFFLELDRSTESLDSLTAKARRYLEYYRSGGFAERNGTSRLAFRKHPFRVLMVLATEERRNNVAERLLRGNPPVLRQIHLSTLAQVLGDPLGAIWIRPMDYRAATEGTTFKDAGADSNYRRSSERDELVRDRVVGQRILQLPD